MGGLAFSAGEDPLYTPRMPRDVYQSVKSRCQRLLLNLYVCVASPIEGPSKKDHGDVDILLALPKLQDASDEEALTEISRALKAERVIASKGSQGVATMAIAWPSSPDDDETTQESRKKYIQVDVRVCASLREWHWMMFAKSHGDIGNIIGTIIRPFGLTVSDSAMWLRIPEVEENDRKKARVFLSSEPSEVLSFLGLPIGDYWDRPFDNVQDMYEYVAQCRLMHIPPTDHESTTNDTDIRKLKANDRRRMAQRPAFRKWIEEFIPQCRQQGRFSEMTMTRDDVAKEAFARFHVQEEFNARRDAFLLEKQRDYIWNHSIKENIPEPENREPSAILYRSCLVRAMKRIILEGDERYGIVPEDSLTDVKGRFLMDRVVDFILTKQREVGEAAIERQRTQYREHILSKKRHAPTNAFGKDEETRHDGEC